MGTTDNTFVLYGLVNHIINNNYHHYWAFNDFSKAFDYVVLAATTHKIGLNI